MREPGENVPLTAAPKRIFSYDETLALFPLVRELTRSALAQIAALMTSVSSPDDLESRREEVESAYQAIILGWAHEVVSLGCVVKGLWLVDWDNGDGYYCWKYPEETVGYFHGYDEGYAGRVPIN